MSQKIIFIFLIVVCVLTCNSCGGELYRVAHLPATPLPATTYNAGHLTIKAQALDGDQSLERFEANLPLAGIIPVDVQLTSQTPLSTNTLKFELRDANGKVIKRLTPKNALKRVMRFYDDRFYRIDARQRTIESYEVISFPSGSTITAQGECRGILFFELPRTAKSGGLTLQVIGAPTPIKINLN